MPIQNLHGTVIHRMTKKIQSSRDKIFTKNIIKAAIIQKGSDRQKSLVYLCFHYPLLVNSEYSDIRKIFMYKLGFLGNRLLQLLLQ